MIVILKMRGQAGAPLYDDGTLPKIAPEIAGWIIAPDMAEARRIASAAGEQQLASSLYAQELDPRPGRYEISLGWVGEQRYVMLVS